MKLFISGSLAYDRIMAYQDKFSNHFIADEMDRLNVSFVVNNMKEMFGGTAGNIAYTLALLEESPTILASAGANDFKRYADWLSIHGLLLDGIRIVEDAYTAGCYIVTDENGNQINFFYTASLDVISDFSFPDVGEAAFSIVSPGNLDDMEAYARYYQNNNIPYIADPGQMTSALPAERLKAIISGADILISNGYELEMIKEKTGWSKTRIKEETGSVITTLGANGAQISTPEGNIALPIVSVREAIDPTGAGDAFRAGLLKGLALGKTLKVAAQMGTVSASFCVEFYGTQEHIFDYNAFCERYNQNYDSTDLV